MTNSTKFTGPQQFPKSRRSRKKGPAKPDKPYPDFPLFPHATKRWAKKILGKIHYFGPWADPDGALNKYLDQKDDLHAGRKPRAENAGLKVAELCDAFLVSKRCLVDTGELAQRTWDDYRAVTDKLVEFCTGGRLVADLRPEDFERLRASLARKWGPVSVGNFIQRARCVFKYGVDNGLMDKAILYGQGFKRPSKKTLRLHRQAQGVKMFEAAEIRAMLDGVGVVGSDGPRWAQRAGVPLRAMILLGVNAGLGNADCGRLPQAALDLERGWITYHREKTGIPRRCWLWPETVEAIRAAIAERPTPKDDSAGLVFVTRWGEPWYKGTTDNPITKEMAKLLKDLGINGHRNFYCLRHTFETIGGESRDQAAVDHIMGHARDDMASVYRERIGDDRLQAVAEHVRQWLYGAAAGK